MGDAAAHEKPLGWTGCVALALVHVATLVAAFEPVSAWPLIFFSAAPLTWLSVRASTARRAAGITFVVSLAAWLWVCRWVIPVTGAGYPAMCAYLALYPTAYVLIIRRLLRHRETLRLPPEVLVPVAWVGVECVRGEIVFGGYRWYLAAHPTAEWVAFAQSADLLGAYFVSALVLLPTGVAMRWLLPGPQNARQHRRAALAATAIAAVVLAANVAYGWQRMRQDRGASASVRLLVVQTNLPQDNKLGWPREQQVTDVAEFVQLTEGGLATGSAGGNRPDLVVWPETMLPGYGLEGQALDVLEGLQIQHPLHLASMALDLVNRHGVPLLVGSQAYIDLAFDPRGDGTATPRAAAVYNSAYLVQGEPPFQRYDKVVLTPFGETMPYVSAWPWLERQLLAFGAGGMSFDLDAAVAPKRLRLRREDGDVVIGTPICFEDTVARLCRRMAYADGVKKADLFVNLSNDGWFGRDDGSRAQHVQAARFRCIENRVPMVRCVNTGYSVSIDSCGRVVQQVGDDSAPGAARRAGTFEAHVMFDARYSLYGRAGDAWAWACLGGSGLAVALTLLHSRKESSE